MQLTKRSGREREREKEKEKSRKRRGYCSGLCFLSIHTCHPLSLPFLFSSSFLCLPVIETDSGSAYRGCASRSGAHGGIGEEGAVGYTGYGIRHVVISDALNRFGTSVSNVSGVEEQRRRCRI